MEIGKEMYAVIHTQNTRYEIKPVTVTNVGSKYVTVETEDGYFHTFRDNKERLSGQFANYLCETLEDAEQHLELLSRFKATQLSIRQFTEMLDGGNVPAHIVPLVMDAIRAPKVLVHYKQGKRYPYLGKGLDATTGLEQVYYMEPDGSMIYNRTPEEMFMKLMTNDGKFVQRFILEDVKDE